MLPFHFKPLSLQDIADIVFLPFREDRPNSSSIRYYILCSISPETLTINASCLQNHGMPCSRCSGSASIASSDSSTESVYQTLTTPTPNPPLAVIITPTVRRSYPLPPGTQSALTGTLYDQLVLFLAKAHAEWTSIECCLRGVHSDAAVMTVWIGVIWPNCQQLKRMFEEELWENLRFSLERRGALAVEFERVYAVD